MKCLVTGGAGFIGSSIVGALLKKNAEVHILDNLFSGKQSYIDLFRDKVEFFNGDIRDKEIVKRAMQGVDFVFHQAALKLVPDSFNNPDEYNDVNITGTLLLLKEAHKAKVKKFVYASSSSAYGDSQELPKVETHPVNPISPYAVAKLAAENYCEVFTKNYQLPTVSLRYFNVFGPRQDLTDGYSNVIPKFIYSIMENEPPPVFGDGKQSRDFTYIDNVVQANLLAVEKLDVTGVFNVGMGERHDLLAVIDIINKILNKNVKPHFGPPSKGDVRHTLASIEKISRELGYKSELTFEEGLRRTVEWFRSKSA